jgi:hypothetical protein
LFHLLARKNLVYLVVKASEFSKLFSLFFLGARLAPAGSGSFPGPGPRLILATFTAKERCALAPDPFIG